MAAPTYFLPLHCHQSFPTLPANVTLVNFLDRPLSPFFGLIEFKLGAKFSDVPSRHVAV